MHFEQGGQSVTGCLAGAYSMTPLTPAVNGDNGLYAFVLEEAEFPIPSELTNLIISPQYATAPLTNHQLMVLVIEGASGDPSTTQGSASNSKAGGWLGSRSALGWRRPPRWPFVGDRPRP